MLPLQLPGGIELLVILIIFVILVAIVGIIAAIVLYLLRRGTGRGDESKPESQELTAQQQK